MFFNVSDPVFDVVKGLLIRNVIDQHDSHGSSIISSGDCPESLLSCCIPDLKFNLLPIQFYRSDLEVNACSSAFVSLDNDQFLVYCI